MIKTPPTDPMYDYHALTGRMAAIAMEIKARKGEFGLLPARRIPYRHHRAEGQGCPRPSAGPAHAGGVRTVRYWGLSAEEVTPDHDGKRAGFPFGKADGRLRTTRRADQPILLRACAMGR